MKIILLFSFLIFWIFPLFPQEKSSDDLVQWMTIQEALEKNKTTPKKIFIDVYTSWCGWCKVMDKNTFHNPNIAAYINQNFYPVRFDAETHDTIKYKGKDYVNNGTGNRPPHDFAIEILKGQLSYPTIVYMDEKSDLITAVSGYMTPDQIEPVLIFFNEDVYKQLTYEKFKKYFEETFKDTVQKPETVKWYSVEDALKLNKEKPRKIVIFLDADYSPLAKIMNKTSFNNPVIAKYLNDNFYPVKFNALSKDTVNFLGTKYINENKEHPFHQFAVVLLQGKMKFPNMVFMNESNQLITQIPEYLGPELLEAALAFFKEDAYKTKAFEAFRAEFKGSIKE